MKLAITGALSAREQVPLVLRGPYEEIIAQAAQLGYQALELHLRDSADLDRAALRALFDRNDITLSSIGTGWAYSIDGISLSHPEEDRRRRAVECLRQHMLTAKDYGAVIIIGGMKGKITDCSDREEYDRNLDHSLRQLLVHAEEHRVTLVLEILNRYESQSLNTIEEGLAYIARFDSPYLKLHIDTYHMNIEEADIGQSIRRAAGQIGHCHIADSDRWYAGHGHYDFVQTLDALKEVGYDGALAVESFQYPEPLESARRSLETLRRAL